MELNNRARMDAGQIYDPGDDEIMEEQSGCLEKLYDFNETRPSEMEKRTAMLKDMFGQIGTNCYIEPPFHANWGGKHVYMGNHVYANFNLTLVDDGNIYIGNDVMFGPNVTIVTAGHPVEPHLRKRAFQYNADVRIDNNVWIGAGAIVLPGVTIGENSVIGAGSVVTRDIPANVVAVGNPCRILREIGDHDREYYFRQKKVDLEIPLD
jgi:galactoside O-acetyltransferase